MNGIHNPVRIEDKDKRANAEAFNKANNACHKRQEWMKLHGAKAANKAKLTKTEAGLNN